jgi:hypothetical protein
MEVVGGRERIGEMGTLRDTIFHGEAREFSCFENSVHSSIWREGNALRSYGQNA